MQTLIGNIEILRDALRHRRSELKEVFDANGLWQNYESARDLDLAASHLTSAIEALQPLLNEAEL